MRLSPRGNPEEIDPEEAYQHMGQLASQVYANVVAETPIDTGELAASWEVEWTSNSFVVGSKLPYASYPEFGTQGPIVPKDPDSFLVFESGGYWYKLKEVSGQVGQLFVRKALQKIFPESRISSKK